MLVNKPGVVIVYKINENENKIANVRIVQFYFIYLQCMLVTRGNISVEICVS